MYCNNCGKTLKGHLNYCNHCGTRVEIAPAVTRTGSPVLAIAGAFVGMIGLMAFYPILRELIRSPLDTAAVIVILIAYLLTVFAMFGVLIWQGKRGSQMMQYLPNRASDDTGTQGSFRGINTAQLDEHRTPVMSVTDHTTKTLDKVPYK